jgi:hypothetical protein
MIPQVIEAPSPLALCQLSVRRGRSYRSGCAEPAA